MFITLPVFLVILTVLVLIHEAGHFFVARFFNIKVEEFGFGFPPRALGIKRGETIYSINWLPIGGFVKLYGEDEAGAGKVVVSHQSSADRRLKTGDDVKRAFFSRPAWQRALVVVAGVIMNALLAVVIYYVYMLSSGFQAELPALDTFHFYGVNQSEKTQIVISDVQKASPADKAGIPAMSGLVAINGEKVVTSQQVTALIKQAQGTPITLTWSTLDTHQLHTVIVTPRLHPTKGEGAVGIEFFPSKTFILTYATLSQKIFSGIMHPINLMLYNFDVISKLIAVSFQEHTVAPVSQGVSGPVGIYSLVGSILNISNFQERILQLLNLAGILSISLAFMNVLPIPALDGGRLFFILIELVSRRRLNPKFEGYANAVGMAVLLCLILLITVKDIGQFFLHLF